MGYRADIDGLRAIAVLGVLIFHAGFSWLPGGFVGVDVFFVISGYLITGILMEEIREGKFSLAAFYERRFRRIFPALVVVLSLTFCAGLFLSTNEELIDVAGSAQAAIAFYSNLFFYNATGYFAVSAENQPLLHTWSLGVEEQFYVFFPLLLLMIAHYGGKKYFALILLCCLLSFVGSIWAVRAIPDAAFYWIPFRAWELMLGALLVLKRVEIDQRFVRELLSLVGLLLIISSMLLFSHETRFPGESALIPTLGTALIILSFQGEQGSTWVNRALALRPLVFIGLLSYSLYLWHWPIAVFAKRIWADSGDYTVGLLIVVFSFVFSYLTWKWVEKPFRKKRELGSRKAVLAAFLFAVLGAILLALVVQKNNGFPERYAEISGESDRWRLWHSCGRSYKYQQTDDTAACNLGEKGPAAFVLWGDSHAMAMASAVDASALKYGLSGKLVPRPACAPLLGIHRKGDSGCSVFNRQALEMIKRSSAHLVILAARWPVWVDSSTGQKEKEGLSTIVDQLHESSRGEELLAGLSRTIKALSSEGKTVVLVGTVPEARPDILQYVLAQRIRGKDPVAGVTIERAEYNARVAESARVISVLQAKYDFPVLRPEVYLCDEQLCRAVVNGKVLYRDDDHLSEAGALFVSRMFDATFAGLAGRTREQE